MVAADEESTWEQEAPKALPPEILGELLGEAAPQDDPALFAAHLMAAVAGRIGGGDPGEEMRRRLRIVRHRGRHVLHTLRSATVLEVAELSVAEAEAMAAVAREELGDGPVERDLLDRVDAAVILRRAWEAGTLVEDDARFLIHLLVPTRPRLLDRIPDEGPVREIIEGLAGRRAVLDTLPDAVLDLLQPELDRVLDDVR